MATISFTSAPVLGKTAKLQGSSEQTCPRQLQYAAQRSHSTVQCTLGRASSLSLKTSSASSLSTSARAPARSRHVARADNGGTGYEYALLFDCDGVIVETEELHRKAYNGAFEAFQLKMDDGTAVNWSVEYYEKLANTVGGGKPKMNYHFNTTTNPAGVMGGVWPSSIRGPPPTTDEEKVALIDALQDKKTEVYKVIVEEVAVARLGVLELMDEGLARPEVAMGICSAATLAGFEKVVNAVVGPERLAKFDVILAGDQVTKKKPDPMIYNMARDKIGVPADKCVVIEDSLVGLKAASDADMVCIITPTPSTANADFMGKGAAAVLDHLLDNGRQVEIDDIFGEGGLLDGQCNVDRDLPLCGQMPKPRWPSTVEVDV